MDHSTSHLTMPSLQKGSCNGICNISGCNNRVAVHYDRVTYKWYCTPCTRIILQHDTTPAICSWPEEIQMQDHLFIGTPIFKSTLPRSFNPEGRLPDEIRAVEIPALHSLLSKIDSPSVAKAPRSIYLIDVPGKTYKTLPESYLEVIEMVLKELRIPSYPVLEVYDIF